MNEACQPSCRAVTGTRRLVPLRIQTFGRLQKVVPHLKTSNAGICVSIKPPPIPGVAEGSTPFEPRM